jgi:ABC-type branched-subunit amino acid transport system substrate-binding protein
MNRQPWKRVAVAVGAALLGIGTGCSSSTPGPTIKGTLQVKAFFDETGPTSAVTASFNNAILDAIDYFNANGGIQGYNVVVESADNAYKADIATALVTKWRTQPEWADVVGVFGNGTDATLAVAPVLGQDQKPLFTTSYAASLGAPQPVAKTVSLSDGSSVDVNTPGYPYVFYPGTDYSTSIRVAMQFIHGKGGRKVAFAYCGAGYCTQPIAAGKDYARQLGLTVLPDVRPELTDTAAQIDQKTADYFASGANADVEWFWMGNTTQTAVMFAQSVAAHGPATTKVISNVWGIDENSNKLCTPAGSTVSPCIGRVYGLLPFAAYGDLRYPGMENFL